jgi:hypothetical protein
MELLKKFYKYGESEVLEHRVYEAAKGAGSL